MKKGAKGQFLLLFLSFSCLALAVIFVITMMLYSPPVDEKAEGSL